MVLKLKNGSSILHGPMYRFIVRALHSSVVPGLRWLQHNILASQLR
jgi:hypothetical protein